MPDTQPLHDAFLEDHRKLTRGLSGLIAALAAHDMPGARRTAERLDREAGPHMAFEETVFYPACERFLGEGKTDTLYDEHAEGQAAVRWLLDHEDGDRLGPADRARLLAQVRVALDHAIGCGSLLSYVERLEPAERRRMLERLLALRREGPRWTSLATREHHHQHVG